MTLPRMIWSSLGTSRAIFLAGLAATLAEGLLRIVAPLATGLGILRLAAGDASPRDMLPYVALVVAAAALRAVLMRRAWLWGFSAGSAATEAIRNQIADHMRRVSLGIYRQWNAAKLASLLTEDARWINEVSTFTLSRIAAAAMMTIGCLLAAIWLAPVAGITALFGLAAGFGALRLISDILPRMIAQRNIYIAGLIQRVGEYGEGIAVLRSFNRAGSALIELRRVVDQLRSLMVRETLRIVVLGQVGLMIIAAIPMLAILTFAWFGVFTGREQAAAVVVALLLILALRNTVLTDIVLPAGVLALGLRAHRNIAAFLNEPVLGGNEISFRSPLNAEFGSVSFRYAPDQPRVLRDISLAARAGTMTAIVGPSGAGKSTLIAMLMRFFDPEAGTVRLGGLDLKQAEASALHARISLVSQDVHLFNDTLRANIMIGNPSANEEEFFEAVRAARLEELVRALPHGLDTPVGDNARMLSGGERQRVAIARAFLKNAPVMIFDEATSAVDPLTEEVIAAAISAIRNNRTVIVIAHRPRAIEHADRILVMDSGRIVENGTHRSLLDLDGLYARLHRLQAQAAGWRVR